MIADLLGRPDSGVALLYHDVVAREAADSSGFVTEGSWRYKLPPDLFERHLAAVADSAFEPALVTDPAPDLPVYLTFDDGGRTATVAARALEDRGFRGHFFVVVDRVGDDGFLDWADVRDLHRRGHVVGSHTMTHANLLEADPDRRREELVASKRAIESELGQCPSISIPLGAYDGSVFDAVDEAGYEYVFTSEPVRTRGADGGGRIGRWNVWHDTGPADVRDVLDASPAVVLRTAARWYGIKYVKRLVGYDRFVRLRDAVS